MTKAKGADDKDADHDIGQQGPHYQYPEYHEFVPVVSRDDDQQLINVINGEACGGQDAQCGS